MITLVQKAMRYAAGGSKSTQLEETVSCRPKLEDFVSTSLSGPETKEFEGLVTSTDCSCVVIDQDVYCDPSDFPPNRKVSVGVRVRGLAQRGGKHEMWRAKKIEVVQEDWDASLYCSARISGDGKKSTACVAAGDCEATPCKDLAKVIPGSFKRDFLSSVSSGSFQPRCLPDCSEALARTGPSKAVIGKVTGIYGDTVTLNDSVCCSLASANTSMDLVTGDWIVCDVDGNSCVTGEPSEAQGIIQVSSFKPLRKKRVKGEVTHSYRTHFIVNDEIFCSRTIRGAAFAKTGDAMTVEVIESQQGSLCWRGVIVASAVTAPSTQDPGSVVSMVELSTLPDTDIGRDRMQKMIEDKGDIVITQTIRFPQVTFGAAAFTDVSIENIGPRPRTLKRVYFACSSQESQFSVTSCSAGGLVDGTARTLEPGAKVMVKLCCAGTLIGLFRQLCIFEFESFHVGRHVSGNVEDPVMASLAPASCHTHWAQHHSLSRPNERGIITGQRSFKPSPFIPVKLPGMRVPESLWHEVNMGDLFHVAAELREPLSADNHKKKFSLLLHLEEIKMTQQMREFDIARASFTVCGEFLSLTVPGLAEKRPSLLIGDTVIATDLCNNWNVEYEGCIHQVLHTQILLKFHSSFHNNYHGEDYKVRFNFNRTPLRRCHFALTHTMRQLGPDVLFPFRLKLQLPQVCYIDPEVQQLTRRWKQCLSTSHQLPFVAKASTKLAADVSECSSVASEESESDNKDTMACHSKQKHEQEKGRQALSQHKNIQQDFSNSPEWVGLHHEGKANKVVTPTTKLIPRCLDLAVYRSANRDKTSGNRNKELEAEGSFTNENPSMKEDVSNFMCGNYHLENKKRNNLTVGNSLQWMKEKHTPSEFGGNEQHRNSKAHPSERFGSSVAHTTLKNKVDYVVPVLPLPHSREKTQNFKKLPVLKWFNKSLNQEQKLAVRRILEGTTRPLPYIIFGPPGTGKTVTVVEAALQILTLIHHSRLLLVTPSNSASDLVAERLVEFGGLETSDMVRLIAYQRLKESIPEVILPYCCNGDEVEVRTHQRVVVATATCAGMLYMQGLHREHFTHVLVDEAGQLTEPECLLPLGLVNRVTGQIVLAGDPKQLGPVIQSGLARQGGLEQSLLQRLCQTVLYQAQEESESSGWEYEPSLVTQLVRNYRSHPHILAVPSCLFYNNTLQACADVKAQEHLLLWEELPCHSCPILFHGVDGTNLQEGESPSWFNPAEAFQVVRYTNSLLLHGVEKRNIGIITPYRKQASLHLIGREGPEAADHLWN
ncbi:RNA helicase Mov10l1-like isoform X2 [Scylla paramamosain]|uniref:RNA helicase Mov10l1-like isoform X2 n=1 Tax=Scylla paramamosain TaxID=85552 RepID=UPI003083B578